MTPNPLNGSLSVAVAGGSDHVFNVREKSAVCGKRITPRHELKNFPMDSRRACLTCVLGTLSAILGHVEPSAPEESTGV